MGANREPGPRAAYPEWRRTPRNIITELPYLADAEADGTGGLRATRGRGMLARSRQTVERDAAFPAIREQGYRVGRPPDPPRKVVALASVCRPPTVDSRPASPACALCRGGDRLGAR